MRTDDGFVGWLMRRYGVCRADAEDILQASLLRLVHDYRVKHPDANEAELQAYLDALPEGVLYQTLHWQACNWLRARRREQTTLACWMQQRPCEDDPEQAAVERVYAEWLASLLPDGAQEIHALLEAGYTWDEIAEQLGVRPSAAKMRFQRGVAQVRQKLGLGCDDLAVCGVNRDGGRETGVAPTQSQMEVHDEESSEMADGQLERVDRCEHGGSAVDPCRPQRTRRGGGGEFRKSTYTLGTGCSQPAYGVTNETAVRMTLRENQLRLHGGGGLEGEIPLPGPVPIQPIIIAPPGGSNGGSNDCCTFVRDTHCLKRYFCRTTYNCGRIFQRHRWYFRWECQRSCNQRRYFGCTEWQPTPETSGDDLCCQWSQDEHLPDCVSTEPNPIPCPVLEIQVP
jgi:RNA polymerase sigma factor (sigma-70 family)